MAGGRQEGRWGSDARLLHVKTEKMKGVLQETLDLKLGEPGLCGDLGARHVMTKAKDEAGAMDGLEAGAAVEKDLERELGIGRGKRLFDLDGVPALLDVVMAPVVGGAAFGDGEEPTGKLLVGELVATLMEEQEDIAGQVLGDLRTGDSAQAEAVDRASVRIVDLVEVPRYFHRVSPIQRNSGVSSYCDPKE